MAGLISCLFFPDVFNLQSSCPGIPKVVIARVMFPAACNLQSSCRPPTVIARLDRAIFYIIKAEKKSKKEEKTYKKRW